MEKYDMKKTLPSSPKCYFFHTIAYVEDILKGVKYPLSYWGEYPWPPKGPFCSMWKYMAKHLTDSAHPRAQNCVSIGS